MANFCEILWTKVTELDRKNTEETQTKTSFLDMMNPRILPTPYGGREVVVYDQWLSQSLFYVIFSYDNGPYEIDYLR